MTPVTGGLVLLCVAVVIFMYMTTRSSSATDIRKALESGAKIVDVRSTGEFSGGHFPGAINIPVDQLAARLDKIGDKSQTVLLYCHSGMRAGSARHILTKNGFTNVVNGGSLHRMNSIAGK